MALGCDLAAPHRRSRWGWKVRGGVAARGGRRRFAPGGPKRPLEVPPPRRQVWGCFAPSWPGPAPWHQAREALFWRGSGNTVVASEGMWEMWKPGWESSALFLCLTKQYLT